MQKITDQIEQNKRNGKENLTNTINKPNLTNLYSINSKKNNVPRNIHKN